MPSIFGLIGFFLFCAAVFVVGVFLWPFRLILALFQRPFRWPRLSFWLGRVQ